MSYVEPVNAVFLVGALQLEVQSTRSRDVIDSCLVKVHFLAQSDKGAERLVTAGIVPTLIYLLKIRAADGEGLEIVLACLGLVAYVQRLVPSSFDFPHGRFLCTVTIQSVLIRSSAPTPSTP